MRLDCRPRIPAARRTLVLSADDTGPREREERLTSLSTPGLCPHPMWTPPGTVLGAPPADAPVPPAGSRARLALGPFWSPASDLEDDPVLASSQCAWDLGQMDGGGGDHGPLVPA